MIIRRTSLRENMALEYLPGGLVDTGVVGDDTTDHSRLLKGTPDI